MGHMGLPKLFVEPPQNKAQQICVRILCDILHASSGILCDVEPLFIKQ